MIRLLTTVFMLLIVGLLGFIGYIAVWDLPAPAVQVEKVIPDDRFPE